LIVRFKKIISIPIWGTLLLLSQQIYSQENTDSSLYYVPVSSLNRLFSNFDKQLNTYYLNTGFDLYGSFSNFEYKVNQNYRSTLIQSSQNNIRDEEYLFALAKYKVSSVLKPGLAISSNIVSDDRQLGINEATIYHAVALSELSLLKGLILTPYGGYSDNRQVNEIDTGPIYGFESKLNQLYSTDFDINSKLRFENEDISPRKNSIRYLDLLVTSPFNPEVTNFLDAGYSDNRKDFYIIADSITTAEFNITNNIESRTETAFILQDRIDYSNFLNLFSFQLAGRINFRTIDRQTRYKSTSVQSPSIFDTQVEELGIAVESGLFYRTESVDVGISLNYFERDEKHITKNFEGINESFYEQRSELEGRKNNNSYRTTISLTGNYHLSRKDQISLSLFHSKLKYDTPSGANDDDRDELLSIGRLKYTRYLSPFFQVFSNLEGTLSHLVYLFASRSANNNTNHVLRLSAGGYYKGERFSSLNNFEVSANYTVYDFQDVTSNLRSISFRQFIASDSTNYRLTNYFSFLVTGYIKLTSQAELDWDNFAERPLRYLQEIFLDPKIGFASNYSFFALGLRYFSLSTFRYDKEERIPDSDFLSVGPLFEIMIGTKLLYLKLNSWYEFISDNTNVSRERFNFLLSMNWNF
jgi:hypothetical protein